jgi:predicted porin
MKATEMKLKRNLALLCGTLAAGAACAQSSVTIFGLIDTNIVLGRGSIADRNALGSGGWGQSRLGFRGVEDLGGGLKASFVVEAGINSDDGTGVPSNTNNVASGGTPSCAVTTTTTTTTTATPPVAGSTIASTSTSTSTCAPALNGTQGLTFGRRSYVALAGNWGEVRLGREYTPTYWNALFSDPFLNSGVGATLVYGNAITGVTRNRASNMINYLTPNTLGGFSLNYMHYLGENANNSATRRDGNGDQVRLMYEGGPLTASVGYGRTKATAGDITMANIYATYDFKVVKPSLAMSRDRAGIRHGRGLLLGVTAPFGAHLLRAAYSTYKTDAAGSPTAKKFAIGDVYSLSKRTSVYATYARVKNSGGSATAIGGAVTGANRNSSGFDLGLVHQF